MANPIKRYRRVMAIGCSHGDLIHEQALADVMEFKRRFNPHVRFHLGDLVDSTCFRAGAGDGPDSAKSPSSDMSAAANLIEEYRPTHLAWGNHDWRLHKLMSHPKAIVATLAAALWQDLNGRLAKIRCATRPYDIEDNWFVEGGVHWGHGAMYNMMAVRDHSEMVGGPVVMAHLHAPQMCEGRTIKDAPSFCVGALADDRKLDYGRLRRQSLTHGHGIVYGEISDTEAHLWLIRAANGQPMHFPPGI